MRPETSIQQKCRHRGRSETGPQATLEGGISVIGKFLGVVLAGTCVLALSSNPAAAAGEQIKIKSQWLSHLQLDDKQLVAIKDAVEKALDAPIDAEQECGAVRMDCVVRAAREWQVDGNKYRDIVVDLHFVGHSVRAVGQVNGKWPAVAAQ